MRLLKGRDLRSFCENHLQHVDGDLIGETGLDVRFGPKVWTEKYMPGYARTHELTKENQPLLWDEVTVPEYGFTLKPKAFIKAETYEYFDMPATVMAEFGLRSWAAQSGLEQSTSTTIKPGWSGHLIMELVNELRHSELLIPLRAPIGHVRFYRI